MTNVNFRVEFLLYTACGCFSHDAGGSSRIARTHYVQWIHTMVGKPKEFDCRFYRSSNFGEGQGQMAKNPIVHSQFAHLNVFLGTNDFEGVLEPERTEEHRTVNPGPLIADSIIGYNFKAETSSKGPKNTKTSNNQR